METFIVDIILICDSTSSIGILCCCFVCEEGCDCCAECFECCEMC